MIIGRTLPSGVAGLCLTMGASVAAAAPSANEAADLVERFCTTLIPAVADYDPNAPGIWPPDDPAVFGPLVTPELAAMIEEAAARNAAFEAATHAKGPLGDGVPWKAYQDAVSDCTAGAIAGSAEHPEVAIDYRYDEEPESGWTDTLILARHGDAWRIDDIRYGNPDVDSGLQAVLAAAIAELAP